MNSFNLRKLDLKRGNASLLLMAGIASFITGAAALKYIPLMQRIQSHSQASINHRLALTSALNYTKYAIKNHWCMTTSWLRDGTCDGFKNTMNHPRSFDRMTLTPQAVYDIKYHNLLNPMPSPLTLSSFNSTLGLPLPSAHPLHLALSAVENEIRRIKISVNRISNVASGLTGQEVLLNVRVEEPETGRFMAETVAVFPVDVSNYALITQRDLLLNGRATSAGVNPITFPIFKYSDWFNGANSGGLVFTSPVFSNGSLSLPDTVRAGDDATYTPVTFTDSVVLGAGSVLKDNLPYAPDFKQGMSGLLNSSYSDFGGIANGVILQTTPDRGLSYLFGASGGSADASLMKQCIFKNQIMGDTQVTRQSRFVVTENTSSSSAASYTLGLTEKDEFQNSDGTSKAPVGITTTKPGADLLGKPSFQAGSDKTTRLKLTLKIGTILVDANFSTTSSLKVSVQEAPPPPPPVPAPDPSASPLPKPAPPPPPPPPVSTVTITADPVGKGLTEMQFKINTDWHYPAAPEITFFACDYGTNSSCNSIRPSGGPNDNKPAPVLKLSGSGSSLSFPKFGSGGSWVYFDGSTPPAGTQLPDPDQNLQKLNCLTSNTAAFGISSDFDYSPTAKTSWDFATPDNQPFLLDGTNSATPDHVDFEVAAISNVCEITKDATLVTGFFVCNQLIIDARSAPLQILGTFVVGAMSIDPSAMKAGIRWGSIYAPDALYTLRAFNVLQSNTGMPCGDIPSNPLWNPQLSNQELANIYQCTQMKFRLLADPFTWSEINPLCGLQCDPSGNNCQSATTCNLANHPNRVRLFTLSRNFRL